MSRVYVFSPDNTDYSTVGECGSLMPKDGTYELIANGMGEIAFKHPIDKLGKYLFLQKDAVLKIEVPVRTMPEIESGQFVTQVEKWTVKQTATKNQRYVYTKAVDGKKIKTLKLGAEVVVTQKPDGGNRWKIKSGKTSGWMLHSGLEQSVEIVIPDDATGIEEAAPAVESREQLFCIYDITRMDDEITCYARPIRYDLLYNITTFDTSNAVSLQDALDGVLNNCIIPHDFTAKTNISASRTGAHYADKDPIFAILDPDQGLAAEYRAQFVSDNFELFLLQNAGANRGFRIAFGGNMTGISFNENTDKVATVIRPIGEKKDGKPLYLEGDGVVVSPLADKYRIRKIYPLYCTDCKVGTNGVTTEIARARMREQAQAMFDSGADLPTVNISVTFSDLGDTPRHKQYKNLKTVFLYDEVTVYHPRIGADLTTEVTRIVWDFVRDRMQTVELGSLMAMTPSIASWQIASGISGSKIAGGTIGSAQLTDEAISARHVQAESINTEALQAESVTAEKLHAGAVTADKIAAGAIDTVSLEAVTAKIESLTASDIETDRLAAALAAFSVITAGTASFDRATVEHLVANLFNLTGSAVMEDVFIHNLKIAYAQMVSASIGNLVLQASDGSYYQIDVDQNGAVTTTRVYPSNAEIEEGVFGDTRPIIATQMTVDDMNATTIKAVSMLVNKIDAAKIDTDELFARDAFITQLTTSKIVGDKSLILISAAADDAKTAAEQAKTTADTANDNAASAQTAASDAAKSASAANTSASSAASDASAAKTAATNAQSSASTASAAASNAATSASDAKKAADNASAVANEAKSDAKAATDIANAAKATADTASINAEDALRDATNAGALAQNAVKAIGDIPNYVEIAEDGSGVYVRDIQGESVLKLNSGSVSVGAVSGGTDGYSQLAAKYVQFGNYQLRKSGDGGLVFKLAEG